MRPALTFCVWTGVLMGVLAFAAIAAVLAMIALSLDPAQMIAAGIEPWSTAGLAVVAAMASLVAGAAALRLWHSRFAAAGFVLALAVVGGAVWTCAWIAREYF